MQIRFEGAPISASELSSGGIVCGPEQRPVKPSAGLVHQARQVKAVITISVRRPDDGPRLKHSGVREWALASRRQIVRKLLRCLSNGGEERSHFGAAQLHVAETVLVD